MGETLLQLDSYRPSSKKLQPKYYRLQSTDEVLVAAVCVTVITLPVRGIVKGITTGSNVGAAETTSRYSSSPTLDPPNSFPCSNHARTENTTRRLRGPWPDWTMY
mmetsp:Transcript_36476/g.97092  ORF Transcript_36476/g.97092 Transcript_36476/m.97092 type:complete len:105 (-) Transcript_36476:118-432(-)